MILNNTKPKYNIDHLFILTPSPSPKERGAFVLYYIWVWYKLVFFFRYFFLTQ
jgi:hypothetical protein